MIAIIVTLLILGVALVGMAKRPRRRWGPNDAQIPVFNTQALGALANADLISGELVGAADEEYRALSLKMAWAIKGVTAGEGPVVVGVALGDYTSAEIEEWLEATTAMSRGDMIANEQADRRCRRVGVFANDGVGESLNDGKPITTRLNWHVPEGKTIAVWAYNQSGATLTTGQNITQTGSIRLRWS